MLLALAVSMATERRYTATARIVIEPPAGSDPRSAMVVSPIYLESLKTYEHFASSDSLFQKAMTQFHLRALLGGKAIESAKKSVLKVEIIRNTRILEISATLPDPRLAQSLARFLADSTVALNQSLLQSGSEELLKGIEQQEREARAALERSEAAWAQALRDEPIESLQEAADADSRLREDLQQQAVSLQLEVAGAANRLQEGGERQALLKELRTRIADLDRRASERQRVLAVRLADRDRLETQRKARQAAVAAIEGRLRGAHEAAGTRGERLTVIDPGVVPERPSTPNLPLNVLAALLLGLVLPLAYLALEMHFSQQQAGYRRGALRALGKTADE
ncbi:MAG TPA: hypothetical protein VG672_09085 [Bryobacteraceae bacterium]|nr:hypothetical protein [Bryobacteraceae bacterium]